MSNKPWPLSVTIERALEMYDAELAKAPMVHLTAYSSHPDATCVNPFLRLIKGLNDDLIFRERQLSEAKERLNYYKTEYSKLQELITELKKAASK